ncbi:dixin, partial [Aplysia californica]|uniref:Dixin n=1 Tax=Aplysia californica TaxID=6500 RepID=A0ABM1A337_APLCA
MSAVRTRRVSDSPARPGDSDKMWVQWKQQLTAYVQWVNSQLKKKAGAHLVEDLRHDVRDGVALIDLLEVIAGEKLPEVHPSPSTYGEMRHNVDQVLHFMTSNKIKMHHITTRDIVDGNLKAIMRLILALAAHYKPNSVRHSSLPNDRSLTGLAQGAAAALTEARRSANRAGHRYRRRRQKEEKIDCSDSDHSQSCPIPTPGQRRSGPISLHPPHHQQHHHHHHQQQQQQQ